MDNAVCTVDEIICACIARQVVDGEVLAQGINTPLVMAGFILARLTHAPNVKFASAIGQSLTDQWCALGVARAETMWLRLGLMHVGFAVAAAELLPKYHPKEFFRPAQIDAQGRTNNIAFGRDYPGGGAARLRLPGAGGIPDVTAYAERLYFYVPRHSPVTFVETVDVVSGAALGDRPGYLVSDLGQFDWHDGQMRLTHLHPGVTVEQVQRRTGFPLAIAPDLAATAPPDTEALRLLREQIDPLNVRKLETLGGSARKALLRDILEREGAWL